MLLARGDMFAEISIGLVRVMTDTEKVKYQTIYINQSERYQISESRLQTTTMLSQVRHVVLMSSWLVESMGSTSET